MKEARQEPRKIHFGTNGGVCPILGVVVVHSAE
jgi:hypothetical protein